MGLHGFEGWHKPILTDSGGFQVWSLGEMRKISEEGVRFVSSVNGDKLFLTPEPSMQIQTVLNSAISGPGAEYDPATRWPAAHYAALPHKLDVPVLLFGSGHDAGAYDEIVALAPHHTTHWAGKIARP